MNITEIKGSRKGLHWEQGDKIKNYVSIREAVIYVLAEFVR